MALWELLGLTAMTFAPGIVLVLLYTWRGE